MASKEKIEEKAWELLQRVTEGTKIRPVDAEYAKEGKEYTLVITIDKDPYVTIDDCEEISRLLDPLLVLNVEDDGSVELDDADKYQQHRENYGKARQKDGNRQSKIITHDSCLPVFARDIAPQKLSKVGTILSHNNLRYSIKTIGLLLLY